MGNRAYVVFHDGAGEVGPAVYLHNNGGPESIYAFLAEMERRRIRRDDVMYATARFIHVVGDFFDYAGTTGLSLGVRNGPAGVTPEELKVFAYEDNGLYVASPHHADGWAVRRFPSEDGPEMTIEEVLAERARALAHEYNAGEDTIAKQFLRLRPKVSDYG